MMAASVATVAGGLVVLVGVLGVLGKMPRNQLAGVRTPATMRSDRAYEVGNRAAAPAVIAGGVAAMAGGLLGLSLFAPEATRSALVGGAVMVALVVLGGVLGDRAARRADR